jgi:hypothetical protein
MIQTPGRPIGKLIRDLIRALLDGPLSAPTTSGLPKPRSTTPAGVCTNVSLIKVGLQSAATAPRIAVLLAAPECAVARIPAHISA